MDELYGQPAVAQRRSPELVVSGLPTDSTRASVEAVFNHYGTVIACDVLPCVGLQFDRKAVLRMELAEEADWLVQNLHGQVPALLETPVSVRIAGQGKTSQPSHPAAPEPAHAGAAPQRVAPGQGRPAHQAPHQPLLGLATALQQPEPNGEGLEQWGTVKLWNDQKAFGFIIADVGGPDVFVHKNMLPDGVAGLSRGLRVSFQVHHDASTGKPRALVSSILESAPPADGAPAFLAAGDGQALGAPAAAGTGYGPVGGHAGVPAAFQTPAAAKTARATARAMGIGRVAGDGGSALAPSGPYGAASAGSPAALAYAAAGHVAVGTLPAASAIALH